MWPRSGRAGTSTIDHRDPEGEALLPEDQQVDARGLNCPEPLEALIRAIREAEPGEAVELLSTDPSTEMDIRTWLEKTGHELEEVSQREDADLFRVRKRRRLRG